MIGNDEPEVLINGTKLTVGQSMTMRVAVGSFISSLIQDGLGDDEHGKIMTKAYLDRLREIEDLFFLNRKRGGE